MKQMNELLVTIYYKYVLYFATALFGGIAHALVIQRRGGVKSKTDFLGLAIISGFAGCMWILLALNFFPEKIFLVAFAAGFGGYMSVEGLAMLAAKIQDVITNKSI